MINIGKLDIFALMNILFWDNSENKKHINGKYEPESKKHQKHGESSGVGHKKSSSSKNLEEEDEDEENMRKEGNRHMGNKHNRGY